MTTAKPRPPLAAGETRAYPVLPLRDIVVFPHMIAPLFAGRKKSILALEKVMRSDTFILLACPFRKFHPAWIGVTGENHIILGDVCDLARARNVRLRHV
jgi:ATP-dependent Lon protease